MPITTREVGDDGIETDVTQPSFFQVLEQYHGSSRPKLVPLEVHDDEEEARKATVGLAIQHMDTLRKHSDKSTTCYFDSDPEVVNGLDLWPWPKTRDVALGRNDIGRRGVC